jgi:hypothetical protein
LIPFLFTIIYGKSPKIPSPTTEEEYNYITKGYEIQINNGSDTKKGYKFSQIFDRQQGNYNFNCKSVIRESTKEIAAIMVVCKSKISNKTYYLCIPFNNQQLIERYWSDISSWDKPITTAYAQVCTIYLGSFFMIYAPNDKSSIKECRLVRNLRLNTNKEKMSIVKCYHNQPISLPGGFRALHLNDRFVKLIVPT